MITAGVGLSILAIAVSIGLADPVVSQRFLLFGLFGTSMTVGFIISLVLATLGHGVMNSAVGVFVLATGAGVSSIFVLFSFLHSPGLLFEVRAPPRGCPFGLIEAERGFRAVRPGANPLVLGLLFSRSEAQTAHRLRHHYWSAAHRCFASELPVDAKYEMRIAETLRLISRRPDL